MFSIEAFKGDRQRGLYLIRGASEAYLDRWHHVCDLDVMNWLDNQLAFHRALAKVRPDIYGRSRPSEVVEQDQDARYNFAWERFSRAANDENPRAAAFFKKTLDRVLGLSRASHPIWLSVVVKALSEYYYSDSAAKILDDRRQLKSRIDSAIAGIAALREIDSDLFAKINFESIQERGNEFLPLVSKSNDDLERLLEALGAMSVDELYPIQKLDRTARERLLVYRVARVNQVRWGDPKPAIIEELLNLEGVSAQLDTRNIQRQCTAVNARDRRLFDRFIALTAGQEDQEKLKTAAITIR
ncbi:hypothetical protein [Paraburkholderia azotifigens]|uniref:hypothetical protein n=1 Tax=Paraburkholderia azotifigens TaxID=2057004 RepID=UPI0038B8DB70